MKVLIIGAGALGIGIGASIVDGGMDVDFVARGAVKSGIIENGIRRSGFFKDISIKEGVTGAYQCLQDVPRASYDYVIISAKTTANDEISQELYENKELLKADGCIVFMQNGMGYEQAFLEYFDKKDIFHSRVITGFKKDVSNESIITAHQAPVLIGTLYDGDLERVRPLAEAINKSGLPAETNEEIEKALWAKLIYNTTLNPLGALLRMSYGQLAASDYAHSIMDILIEETFEIMHAVGAKTYWDESDDYRQALFEEMIPVTGEHRSSTLQDIERQKKTEIDTLTGYLLNMASEYNVAAPVQSMIYSLVKAIEDGFED